jgi:hypothetical protein
MHDYPLLTATRFKTATIGALFVFCSMPCEVVAKDKNVITLRIPDAPKTKQLRKVSIIQLRTKDARRREAQTSFVKTMRETPPIASQYFPTPADVQRLNPTY